MKKLRIIVLLLLSCLAVQAQSPEDDNVSFEAAIDWLNSKLEYVYYDETSQNWWTNTFYINENREVTIKQIAAKNPHTANIKEKTYTIRTFRIQDINPFSIEIKEVKASNGRIVKGEVLAIHTFDGGNNIHKTINNRKATSTSYLHLSFPKSLTDTLTNYPQLVRDKLKEAVLASTKIYPTDEDGNRQLIFDVLKGSYLAENGVEWTTEARFPLVLKVLGTDKEQYFGWDPPSRKYYIVSVSSAGVVIDYYTIKDGPKLILQNETDPSKELLLDTFNSFRMNGVWYYRK